MRDTGEWWRLRTGGRLTHACCARVQATARAKASNKASQVSDSEKYLQAFSSMYLQTTPSSGLGSARWQREHEVASIAAAEAAAEAAALDREARAVFVTHDTDCSGTIKDSELRRMLTAMDLPPAQVDAEAAGACWDGAVMNLATFVGYYRGLKKRLRRKARPTIRSWGRRRSASHTGPVGGSERGPRRGSGVTADADAAGAPRRRASTTTSAHDGLHRTSSNESGCGGGVSTGGADLCTVTGARNARAVAPHLSLPGAMDHVRLHAAASGEASPASDARVLGL